MFNVRGINVFPTAVHAAVLSHPELSTGQFRILLHGPGPYDSIPMKVEAAARLPQAQWPASVQILEQTIRNRLGATATVRLIEAGSLPLTDGKTKWIERNAG
jgi:phenylacetate-CoA ligase